MPPDRVLEWHRWLNICYEYNKQPNTTNTQQTNKQTNKHTNKQINKQPDRQSTRVSVLRFGSMTQMIESVLLWILDSYIILFCVYFWYIWIQVCFQEKTGFLQIPRTELIRENPKKTKRYENDECCMSKDKISVRFDGSTHIA